MCFVGDMNWTDSRDGSPPLPDGWVDAWQRLHPGDPGYTYDSNSNPMLPYKNPGLRLDRWVRLRVDRQDSMRGARGEGGRERAPARQLEWLTAASPRRVCM